MNDKHIVSLIAFVLLFFINAWGEDGTFSSSRDYTVIEPPKVVDTLLEVSWKFTVTLKTDNNGTEIPEADISVVVNNNVVPLGRYAGYPKTVASLKKSTMPLNSVLACKTWFGGAGDDLYIAKENDTTVAVFHRHVDEADDVLSPFRKIKRIKIPHRLP